MTQRNPMNDRYQQTGEKKTGKTRKSAASAKPTTKAASSVHIEGKAPKPQGRFARAQRQAQQPKKSSSSQDRYFQPDTPEYRKWRRIWWGFIIAALALTSLSFFAAGWFGGNRVPMYVMLGLGYAALIVAIVIDVTKVRKIRNAAASSGSKSKMSKKQRKAEEARRAEEAARAREAEEAKRAAKAAKKGRGVFGKKKEDAEASADTQA